LASTNLDFRVCLQPLLIENVKVSPIKSFDNILGQPFHTHNKLFNACAFSLISLDYQVSISKFISGAASPRTQHGAKSVLRGL
jgi:hypothetical protein